MKSFEAKQVDDMVRYVIDRTCNMTVQVSSGDTLSIFEDHTPEDKKTIIRNFCARYAGPYSVFTAGEEA